MKDELRIAGKPNDFDELRLAGSSSFDELKKVGEIDLLKDTSGEYIKAIPYEDYFGEMELSEDEKEDRINMAEELEKAFLFLFALILYLRKKAIEITEEYLTEVLSAKLESSLKEVKINVSGEKSKYRFLHPYILTLASMIVQSTLRNERNPWFLTKDRAKYLAEEESNTIHNQMDYQKAIAEGKTKKQWITMEDERVRQTHRDVNKAITGINDTFLVGDALMRYPKDEKCVETFPEECVNCRCTIKYM